MGLYQQKKNSDPSNNINRHQDVR